MVYHIVVTWLQDNIRYIKPTVWKLLHSVMLYGKYNFYLCGKRIYVVLVVQTSVVNLVLVNMAL